MSTKKRLFRYILVYKYRVTFGIALSLVVSILNGASITGLIPIFDSLGNKKNYQFQINLTQKDISLLNRSLEDENLSKLDSLLLKVAKIKKNLNQKFQNMSQDTIVILFCLIILPIYILKLICLAGVIYLVNSAGFLVVRDLRNELYRKIQTLPLSYFVEEKAGNVMSRVLNDVDIIAQLISADLKDAINDFFYIITHLLLLLFLSWKLFFCVIFILPLIMGPIGMFTNKIKKMTLSVQETLALLNGHLQEVFSGIRVIRAFSTEKKELERFLKTSHQLADKNFKNHFYHQIGPSITELASFVITMVFLGIAVYLMQFENMSRGIFMAFLATLIFLMRPFKQMGNFVNSLNSTSTAAKRVFEILDLKLQTSQGGSIRFEKLEKSITFQDVSFSYNKDKLVLDKLNLTIPAKKTIALVGSSGAGKSTIIDLISNLLSPCSGSIFFDDKNLKEIQISDLRKKIGVVSQYHFLFNTTIEENICYGYSNISKKQLDEAVEKSYLSDFINSQPDGLKTVVGEGGVMLSGGQVQRISIARILLADPEILIFDEATSALDNESEKIIQDTLESFYKERTIIIIAHRLRTVKSSDIIYYVEDGKILESGSHEELIEKNSRYKDFYTIQTANL